MDCNIPGFPSFTVSQSLFRLMSVESMIPSNHFILCSAFSSCPQSFLASGSFPVNFLFMSDSQSFGASASASVLAMNIQGWFPLGWTGLISLQSKGLSRVFSKTTIQKHQFFGSQPSLRSSSHIHTWLWEKTQQVTSTTDICHHTQKLFWKEPWLPYFTWRRGSECIRKE